MSEETKARLMALLATIKRHAEWDVENEDAPGVRDAIETLEEIEFLTKELNNDSC